MIILRFAVQNTCTIGTCTCIGTCVYITIPALYGVIGVIGVILETLKLDDVERRMFDGRHLIWSLLFLLSY